MKWILCFATLVILNVFSSCSVNRRLIRVKESLAAIRLADTAELKEISGLKNISESKQKEGKIDSLNGRRILKRLISYEADAVYYHKLADSLSVILENKEQFRKEYKQKVLPALSVLEEYYKRSADRISLYLLIEDGLNIANYHLYELAAFFGPGKYTIPVEKTDSASIAFEPLIDSLIIFSNKYRGKKRTISLVILGFADGTGFSNMSPLADTLKQLMDVREVSKEIMNRKLSELRAEEISKQLAKLYYKKAGADSDNGNLKIEYNYLGKGEAYPLPQIKNYKVDDPRRRIVLCYWMVLPD